MRGDILRLEPLDELELGVVQVEFKLKIDVRFETRPESTLTCLIYDGKDSSDRQYGFDYLAGGVRQANRPDFAFLDKELHVFPSVCDFAGQVDVTRTVWTERDGVIFSVGCQSDLHRSVRFHPMGLYSAYRPVDEVEIEIVGAKVSECLVDGFLDPPVECSPYFAGDLLAIRCISGANNS